MPKQIMMSPKNNETKKGFKPNSIFKLKSEEVELNELKVKSPK